MPGAEVDARCTRWVSAIEEATTRSAPKVAWAQAMISPAGAWASSASAWSAKARRSARVVVSADIFGVPLRVGARGRTGTAFTRLRHRRLEAVAGQVCGRGAGGPSDRGYGSGLGLLGRHTDHAGQP